MRLLKRLARAACLAAALGLPGAARAQDDAVAGFVEANVIAVFYHELAHALIDVLQLPVYGQEEDAADVFSAVLAFEVFEPESAVDIVLASADAFYLNAVDAEARGDGPFYWDEHGPDLQRYYTLLCLAHGGAPEAAAAVMDSGELPEDRAVGCGDEFALAEASWGAVLDEMAADRGKGAAIRLGGNRPEGTDWGALMVEVLAQQAEWLNEDYGLARTITVDVERCGEANAFYMLGQANIVMCTELFDWLAESYRDAQ